MYPGGWALADVPYWFLLGVTVVPYLSAIGWPLAVLLKYLDVITGDTASFGWLPVVVWPSLVYSDGAVCRELDSHTLSAEPIVGDERDHGVDHRVHRGAVGGFYGVAPHSDRRLH